LLYLKQHQKYTKNQNNGPETRKEITSASGPVNLYPELLTFLSKNRAGLRRKTNSKKPGSFISQKNYISNILKKTPKIKKYTSPFLSNRWAILLRTILFASSFLIYIFSLTSYDAQHPPAVPSFSKIFYFSKIFSLTTPLTRLKASKHTKVLLN